MQKILCLLLALACANNAFCAGKLNVAVASNMSHAFTEIAHLYESETSTSTSLTFGSSGNFTRQIVQGAPFRIFLSADRKYVEILRQEGITILQDIDYGLGRIGIFIPTSSALSESRDLDNIIRKLFHGKYDRLVMANPEHAPFGVAARQALQSAGLWIIEKQRLLLAENAAQATQIAMSGNVDVGIIPASHALLPRVRDRGKFYLMPEHWHQPLQQRLLLLAGATKRERDFFDFLREDRVRQIITGFGYTLDTENTVGVHGLAGP